MFCLLSSVPKCSPIAGVWLLFSCGWPSRSGRRRAAQAEGGGGKCHWPKTFFSASVCTADAHQIKVWWLPSSNCWSHVFLLLHNWDFRGHFAVSIFWVPGSIEAQFRPWAGGGGVRSSAFSQIVQIFQTHRGGSLSDGLVPISRSGKGHAATLHNCTPRVPVGRCSNCTAEGQAWSR